MHAVNAVVMKLILKLFTLTDLPAGTGVTLVIIQDALDLEVVMRLVI